MKNEQPPKPAEMPQPAERGAPKTPAAREAEREAWFARIVAERLQEAAARSLRAERAFVTGSLLMIACALFGVYTIPYFFVDSDPIRVFVGTCFFAMQFLIPITTYGAWAAVTPHFDSDEIARIGGVKAIVPLTVMLHNSLTPKQEQAVHALLILLLPRMKASDAPLLTPDSRKAIHSWLASATDGLRVRRYPDNLRIAALKALEQVGDSTAVPYVERLARGSHFRLRNDRVCKAAMECLPMLKANYSKVEASRMLLRASQAAAAPPHLLLRPALGPNHAPPHELLRVADEPLPQPAPPPVSE